MLYPRQEVPPNTSSNHTTSFPSLIAANVTLNGTHQNTTSALPDSSKQQGSSGLSGWAIFLIILGAFAVLILAAYLLYTRQHRARGFSSSPSASGPLDRAKNWLDGMLYRMRNPRARSTSAGFEGISAGSRGIPRSRGALDPDEAWDSRVGNESSAIGGYMDETELRPSQNVFTDRQYEYGSNTEYKGATNTRTENPFSDDHVAGSSLRSISPRPHEDGNSTGSGHKHTRSLFKEEI